MKNFIKIITLFFCTLLVTNVSYAQVKKVKIDALETLMNTKQDKIVIVNLWATFCKPCVEEIPSFVAFAKSHSDVDMFFVSLDLKDAFPKTVNKYIRKLGMVGTNLWLDETDADYFVPKIDNDWSGALPATLIMNKNNGIKIFIDGEMTEKEILSAYNAVKSEGN